MSQTFNELLVDIDHDDGKFYDFDNANSTGLADYTGMAVDA